VVLKPGIDPVQWSQNGSDDDIYTMAKTDSNGQFTLPDGLERGKTYGTVVGSAKSDYRTVSGSIKVKINSPDTMQVNIQLNKK
jgi:hypothetical protein